MKCSAIMRKIDLYFEGRLCDTEFHNIEKHLKVCKTCRDEYKEMEHLFSILSSHQLALPPLEFTKNVMNEISNEASSRNRLSPSVRRLGLSFVAAGLLFVSLNLFSLDGNLNKFTGYISSGSFNLNSRIINPFKEISKGLDYLSGYWSD